MPSSGSTTVQTEQSKRFIEDARAFGADEKRSNADALLGKLAHTPPDPKPKPKGVRKSLKGKKA
jgi:hypothetical protein